MAESVNSSDSESEFSNRDVRLRIDESGTESLYSPDEQDEGIHPYRFEPETSNSDSHSDGRRSRLNNMHDAVAVAHDRSAAEHRMVGKFTPNDSRLVLSLTLFVCNSDL